MQKIPKKLEPVPIISAVVEIKFVATVPPDAVLGIVYPLLFTEYKTIHKLPIVEIPNDIREKDPALRHAPHYEFVDNDKVLRVLVGPKVLAVAFYKSKQKSYPGWTEHIEKKVFDIYEKVFKNTFIKKIDRFGIRYTDFFKDSNIFQNSKYRLADGVKENVGIDEKVQVSRNFEEKNFFHNIVVSNNAEFAIDNQHERGSIIDIDTYKEEGLEDFQSNYKEYLKQCHLLNKLQFFQILDTKYINTEFNAEYEER